MSKELKEQINLLADEYEFSVKTITGWYEILSEYPCFEEEFAATCLENLCQRRISCTIKTLSTKGTEEYRYSEPLTSSIEYAIYATYGDKSASYLSEEFRKEKDITLEIDKYDYDYPDDYKNSDDYDIKIH